MKAEKKQILLVVSNHFDPSWRRCFEKPLVFKDKTYVSYGDLHDYYILDNMELAAEYPDYKFQIESVIVARKFMERHPEHRDELIRLGREGRMYIPGTGDNIIDSNLVMGESIVRNFVSGLLWTEETFGYMPKLSIRFDAFGNSAQLPQILRGCGIEWVHGFSYSECKGKYWKGLDGSVVLHANIPKVGDGGGWKKYAPCPRCSGIGKFGDKLCESCQGRGIDLVKAPRDWMPIQVDEEAFGESGCGMVVVGGEEFLPQRDTVTWAEQAQAHYEVRFATQEDAFSHVAALLAGLDHPDEKLLHPGLELNPNNTGVYVTRIKTKQMFRRQQYELLAAEALCTMAALKGGQYPRERLRRIWEKLFFTMFHDVITGTLVDAAYLELEEIWKEIDAETAAILDQFGKKWNRPRKEGFSVLNLTGNQVSGLAVVKLPGAAKNVKITNEAGEPASVLEIRTAGSGDVEAVMLAEDLPPFSARNYLMVPDEGNDEAAGKDESWTAFDNDKNRASQSNVLQAPVESASDSGSAGDIMENTAFIENRRFLVLADSRGIRSVYDKKRNEAILQTGDYRPGEFILEHDEGSPWSTLNPEMSRTPLSLYTRLVGKETKKGVQRLFFEIELPPLLTYAIDGVRIKYSVALWEGVDRLDFAADVDWDTFNHRLRVAMPVPFHGKHLYEIPYGMLERQPYSPVISWSGTNGDWPAANWAGVEGADASVALFNKGTPSYLIEKGNAGDIMLLSVLRSPAIPAYLHEPEAYSMTEWDGMRDAGSHRFEYAVTAYDTSFADSSVVADADHYNAGLRAADGTVDLPSVPVIRSGSVRISCVKMAESGDSLIVRLVEYRGKAGEFELHLPESVRHVARVNLLEKEDQHVEADAGRIRMACGAFEMITLRMDWRFT